MKINPKQKLFAEYYCGEYLGNAERAALAAGYSPNYARSCSSRLVANPVIQAYIAELNSKSASEAVATISDIKAFWTAVMRDEDEMMKNRLRASELLAKASGMFNTDW